MATCDPVTCGEAHGRICERSDAHERQIAELFAKVAAHCNGGGNHVYRVELERMFAETEREQRAMVETVANLRDETRLSLAATEKRIAAMEEARREEVRRDAKAEADRNRAHKMQVALITGLTTIVVGGLSILGNYMLVAAKLAGK